jgi:hypothetical protein
MARENPTRSYYKKATENKRETQQNECLLVSKSDLREVGSTITPFVILVYKEALFSTNDLPSTLPCAVFDLL